MELGSTVQFLENKNILVTGATGFLAKITVEKILRVQPNVKKLFLLLRATDDEAAALRLKNEIVGKDLFRVLKEKLGANFNSLIAEKITLVPGDICYDDLGVKDPSLIDEMCREVDVIINLAATTKFDERYDVSLGINTLGAKHVLSFAKKCEKIKVVVHVSTAYVSGERGGLIKEEPFYMGETLNGSSSLDIDVELKIAEDALSDLRAKGVSEKQITIAMKELGITRARKHGWPNTYVMTKSMGEMLIGKLKENMPIVILRPTIVTSTFKEPFPGWVEGIRTVDSLAVGYGKGKLSVFLGDPTSTVDLIPADMVVNSILVSMAANASIPSEAIYHVGSSLKNPVNYSDLQDAGFKYFTSKPCINKDGTPVIVGKVKILNSMSSFHRYMALRYLFFLKGLEFANTALCQTLHGPYTDMNRKISYVLRMVELYQPYLFFKGTYDDTNTEELRKAVRANIANEEDMFFFDPQTIDWHTYFIDIHLPGLVKYVIK